MNQVRGTLTYEIVLSCRIIDYDFRELNFKLEKMLLTGIFLRSSSLCVRVSMSMLECVCVCGSFNEFTSSLLLQEKDEVIILMQCNPFSTKAIKSYI